MVWMMCLVQSYLWSMYSKCKGSIIYSVVIIQCELKIGISLPPNNLRYMLHLAAMQLGVCRWSCLPLKLLWPLISSLKMFCYLFWFVLLSVSDKSVLFNSKGEQGNQASVHLCSTSCITSLEQEPCSYLDGK